MAARTTAGGYRVRVLRNLRRKDNNHSDAGPVDPQGAAAAGRHRTDGQDEQAPDDELVSYLAALAPDSDPETTGVGLFGSAQVLQLRLSVVTNEQLRELAAAKNTSPLALAQEWIEQRLEWEYQQYTRG